MTSGSSPARLPALLREPLVHFLAAGLALFALEHAIARDASGEDAPVPRSDAAAATASADGRRAIEAGPERRAELAAIWERQHGAAPTDAELDGLVERWIDEEVLYREGLARGLDRDDPRIRAWIGATMARVLEAETVRVEPTEDELRAYFGAHAAEYGDGERVDFTHVFVARTEEDDDEARGRALSLLAALRAGASPDGLGDTFPGGRRYRQRRLAQIDESFGGDVARTLASSPIGAWELASSRHGLHLLRVEGRAAERAPDFAEARDDVRRAWLEAQRRADLERAIGELRGRWEIVRE